jgi:hypothetical protein
MSVYVKRSSNFKLIAKGDLVDITDDGIIVEDEKTGEQTLEFDVLKEFIGKKINITITNEESEDEV